ncbi:hypothetical protein HS088_TW22G00304 [Tripterygium wilfordii]|uniref:Myb-like domain-containing protein n=1 Tax=Tripterygium wilfordii TaxID=458696 RepID=A0A7J7BXP4_TRIWF|nr:trihelix transcription factor ASR3-like [Tripterygium wilfordii]KAF5726624.1 hypothetical protein HS088_TW22G00304 [Tripterygium wilfordii]
MELEQLSLAPNPVDADIDSPTNGKSTPATDGGDDGSKAPRLPRWTRHEILVLIKGKRVAENRVRRGRTPGMGLRSGVVEPKWASVSSYCKQYGVNRGPVQCRKRWSNLAGDFKKIKEWESRIRDEMESYWVMRNDLRRERRLPGFFDREVYDILDGTSAGGPTGLALSLAPSRVGASGDVDEPDAEEEPVFDSGRSAAAEDGLFSDFEHDDAGVTPEMQTLPKDVPPITIAVSAPGSATPAPISEQQYQPHLSPPPGFQAPGATNMKQPASNPEMGSTSQERRKRRHVVTDVDEETTNLQNQLIDVLERNGKMLSAQLEVQNTNFQLDREQRKVYADGLVVVLNKLADALGRIADKL